MGSSEDYARTSDRLIGCGCLAGLALALFATIGFPLLIVLADRFGSR
ncbi:hypothetical protein ACWD4F_27110 [Streptomyces aureus]|nr:hypothetical protein [Streptomyces aureus]